jgi:hypothetical protein
LLVKVEAPVTTTTCRASGCKRSASSNVRTGSKRLTTPVLLGGTPCCSMLASLMPAKIEGVPGNRD